MGWRLIFSVFSIPWFILAWMMWKVFRPKAQTQGEKRSSFDDWKTVLCLPNIRVLTLLMLCCPGGSGHDRAPSPPASCSISASRLKRNEHHRGGHRARCRGRRAAAAVDQRQDRPQAGDDDLNGRRLPDAARFQSSGTNVPALFAVLFMVQFFNNAMITLIVGPLCSEPYPRT